MPSTTPAEPRRRGEVGRAAAGRLTGVCLVVTSQCNLHCEYCYQGDRRPGRMDPAVARSAIDLLFRKGRRPYRIHFYGGEPALQFGMIREIVEWAGPRRPPRSRVEWTLTTNGTLLDDAKLRFLIDHDSHLRLSFDGTPGAQDRRARGSFQRLDRLLDRIRSMDPGYHARRLRVQATFDSTTVGELARANRYFLAKGLSEYTIFPVITPDAGWGPGALAILRRQFELMTRDLARLVPPGGEIPLVPLRPSAGFDPAPGTILARPMCGAALPNGLVVDVDGRASGCVTFVESYQSPRSPLFRRTLPRCRLGDFRDPSFPGRLAAYPAALAATGLFHNRGRKYSSHGRCSECPALPRCAVCPVAIALDPANADPDRIPDHLCAFNRLAHEYRLRLERATDPLAPILQRRGRRPVFRFLESISAGRHA